MPAGRPKGSKNKPKESVDNIDIAGLDPVIDVEETAGPDSVATQTPRPRKKKGKLDFTGFASLLVMGHAWLASLSGIEEFVISEEDAASLSNAAAKVARHYDIPELSEKVVDWTGLILSLSAVYGTRIIRYRAKMATQEKKNPEQDLSNSQMVPAFTFSNHQNAADFPISTS